MAEYSPIQKIYIRNFRNLDNVEIDFTQSPIVSLVGDNEAGKTSVVKAISVCALHDSPKSQKGFIRTGTDKFGIGIELQDKTLITRIKAESGLNKYSIKYPDGREFSIDKLADGLPIQVQEIMGLLKEPETGEYLQIRTYENLLLFALTPSSTNYKMVYEALNIEQIVKAIKRGSAEANALKNVINSNISGMQALNESMQEMRTFDVVPLVSIRSKLDALKPKFERSKRIIVEVDHVESIERSMTLAKKLNESGAQLISESTADKLMRISNSLNSLKEVSEKWSKVSEVSGIEYVDDSRINKFNNVLNLMQNIENLDKEHSKISSISEVEAVESQSLNVLSKLSSVINTMATATQGKIHEELTEVQEVNTSQLKAINSLQEVLSSSAKIIEHNRQLEEVQAGIQEIKKYLIENNVMTGTCDKCGETVIMQAVS